MGPGSEPGPGADPSAGHAARVDATAIRVFVAHAYVSFRAAIARAAAAAPDVELVGDAGTARQALDSMVHMNVDVAVVDENLPDRHGVAVCRDVRTIRPGAVPCILLTSSVGDDATMRAILAGAAAHLPREADAIDVLTAVRAIARGRVMLIRRSADEARGRLRAARGAGQALPPVRQAILNLIADGLTDTEIASRLGLGPDMVKIHVALVLEHLGFRA
jgi:DNA-binding NarL/FixJ family response regulator